MGKKRGQATYADITKNTRKQFTPPPSEALNTTTPSTVPIEKHHEIESAATGALTPVITLCQKTKAIADAYSKQKTSGWTASLFSPINPERIDAICFINSIEKNASDALFEAACIHVMLSIEKPYRNAWFFKDPNGSSLYKILYEIVGKKTKESQHASLQALQNQLEEKPFQANIVFSRHSPAFVIANIEQQIKDLIEHTKIPATTHVL